MIGKRTLALSAALGIIGFGTPSYSLDFDTILRQYLGVPNTAALDSQNDIKTSINTRQAQLEAEVEAGARSGHLTPAEETELRGNLNNIALVEGAALADGNLTPAEISNLVNELTNASTKINTYLVNATVTGYASTRHPGGSTGWSGMYRNYRGRGAGDEVVANQAAVQALIDSRRAQLSTSIESSLVSGRIDWQDASRLKTELQRISTQEVGFLADAKLTITEEKTLTDALSALDSQLQSQIAWGNRRGRGNAYGRRNQVNRYQSALARRIDKGVSSGRLTAAEASRLRTLEAQTRTLEAQLRSSGGRLSYSEERQLMTRLDRLSARITRELTDKQVW